MTSKCNDSLKVVDYWAIMALEARGHIPTDIETQIVERSGRQLLVYVFPKEAEADLKAWQLGSEDEPFKALRKFRESAAKFKYNLIRYRT